MGAAATPDPLPLGTPVLVPDNGHLLPGVVLWECEDTGRRRALVRYETVSGVVVRRLHWTDELRPVGRVIVLPLRVADPVAVASA